MYCTARLDATKETQIEMPKDCPYSIGDVLTKVIAGEYQSKRQRVLDLNKGEIWMSDDFNAPLSDEFWLGKE
ncbi:DUF2281 domain-containing protein [Prochlorothrix hollandica]|nr:DUF2281 domain-containing protein [Prochlorothrix hollandica]